jgi:hypothetical protein
MPTGNKERERGRKVRKVTETAQNVGVIAVVEDKLPVIMKM